MPEVADTISTAWTFVKSHWEWLTGGGVIAVFALWDATCRAWGTSKSVAMFTGEAVARTWRAVTEVWQAPHAIRALKERVTAIEEKARLTPARPQSAPLPIPALRPFQNGPLQREAARVFLQTLCAHARSVTHHLDRLPESKNRHGSWASQSKAIREEACALGVEMPPDAMNRLRNPKGKTARRPLASKRSEAQIEYETLCACELGIREAIAIYAKAHSIPVPKDCAGAILWLDEGKVDRFIVPERD